MDGLKEYIARKAEEIIGDKEKAGRLPASASDLEIWAHARLDILDCMRELHREGRFRGTRTLNHPALMRKA